MWGGGEPAKWVYEAEVCAGTKGARREGGRERINLEEPKATATQSPVPTLTDSATCPMSQEEKKEEPSIPRTLLMPEVL